MIEAVAMLDAVELRCVDTDGDAVPGWDEGGSPGKVGEASRTDRLPGPDYWISTRRRTAERERGPRRCRGLARTSRQGPGSPSGRAGRRGASARGSDAPERAADRSGGIPAGEPSASAARGEHRQWLFGGPAHCRSPAGVEASREALAPRRAPRRARWRARGLVAAGPRVAQGRCRCG